MGLDKEYEQGAKAYKFIITNPAVTRILNQAGPSFEYRIVSALKKDSMDITDEDRQTILKSCLNQPEKHIIITHGTDTIKVTAETLDQIKNKVIVLTGALRPERFYNSDATFNVATAIGAINILPTGVYIAMSGRVLPWNKFNKDPETGQFKASQP